MQNLSVIIPSKTASNFLRSAGAVRRHEPERRIILVDDGMDLSWMPRPDLMPCYGIKGVKPFIFARNVNIGIRFADPDDVVILNDDAQLESPEGFSLMQQAAEDHPEYGLIGAVTNNVGNPNQFRQAGAKLRFESRMVCFTCVLIPRRTIKRIGLLDEAYEGYGCEDDDYCLRVRRSGLWIGIHDGCYVDHRSLPSSFRGPSGNGGDFRKNLEIFKTKWGVDNHGRPA